MILTGCTVRALLWRRTHLAPLTSIQTDHPLRFFCVIFVQVVTAKMKEKNYTYNCPFLNRKNFPAYYIFL